MIGQRFGRFTVIAPAPPEQPRAKWEQGQKFWQVKCDCGTVCFQTTGRLRSGHTRSCGCLDRETTAARNFVHGEAMRNAVANEYRIWGSMKNRCYNPNDPGYRNYGGRGITICKRWREDFISFLQDMGRRPPGRSIDRINNDGNYEPSNCRWATRAEQRSNQRKKAALEKAGVEITDDGVRLTRKPR